MSIRIDHETGLITLHTLHTSYQMWADGQGVVHHLYYGPAIGGSDLRGLEFYSDCGFSPQPAGMDRQRDYSLRSAVFRSSLLRITRMHFKLIYRRDRAAFLHKIS